MHTDADVGPHATRNYVVTQDVGEKIAGFRRIGLQTPDANDVFFTELSEELRVRLETALGEGATVRTVHMAALADDILGKAYEANATRDSLIVSTCPEIAEPMHGITLEVNRLVDIEGNSIGLGPRPGRPPLKVQVEQIKLRSQGRPVTLVEDGIFSGTTLEFVTELFAAGGVTIANIVAGFTFTQAVTVTDQLKAKGIGVHCVEEFDDLLDWVPDHDFFPLIPNCGRVLGVRIGDRSMPYYSHEGACYSIPYVKPLGKMADWASIPEESEDELSKFCLAASASIYTRLKLLNGGDIPLERLIRANQPVCLPVKIGSAELPGVSVNTAGNFLNDLAHNCAFSLYHS